MTSLDAAALLADRWRLSRHEVLRSTAASYVQAVTRADGTPAILKILHQPDGLNNEGLTLRVFDGRGAVRLLDEAPEQHALLVERAIPGTTIEAIDDATAIDTAIAVMRQLRRPPTDPLPDTTRWLRGLWRYRDGPIDRMLIDRARRLGRGLIASAPAPIVLHGDLHQENIVASARGWLAIDPKGLVGEPAFEAGALLRNPHPTILTLTAADHRRIDTLSDGLAVDRTRLRDWAFVQAVLSAIWSIEDGEDPSLALTMADRLTTA